MGLKSNCHQEKCTAFLKDNWDLKERLPEVFRFIDKYFSLLIHMRANNTDRTLNTVWDYELRGKSVTEMRTQIVFLHSFLSKEQPKKREKIIGIKLAVQIISNGRQYQDAKES